MIAISYRREDSLPVAGRCYDHLEARFGKNKVFMDFDSIRPGLDFRSQIKDIIDEASVVIAMIGPNWAGGLPDGTRRIDEPNDFVRLEIGRALERGIPVIPVLINATPMPKAETLPPELQPLVFRHALPLDTGVDFRLHAERLINGICSVTDQAESQRRAPLKRLSRPKDTPRPAIAAPPAAARKSKLRLSRRVLLPLLIATAALCTVFLIVFGLQSRRSADAGPKRKPNAQPTTTAQVTLTPDALRAAEADYSKSLDYYVGLHGSNVDEAQAVALLERAASQHLPEAEGRLALRYVAGKSVTKDKARALSLVQQAVADGLLERAKTVPAAQQVTAMLAKDGWIPGRTPADVILLHEQAASQGDALAQFSLGDFYSRGSDVPVDKDKAAQWYAKAAAQGHVRALINLGVAYLDGSGVPKDLQKGVDLLQQAARKGDDEAQVRLAFCYIGGSGVPKDYLKAAQLLEKPAQAGNSLAQYNLGLLYWRGDGVPKDTAHALQSFNKAAEHHEKQAIHMLGVAYIKGEGVAKDVTKGLGLIQQAADGGNLDAQIELGRLYASGEAVKKDTAKAKQLAERAAAAGGSASQRARIGVLFALVKDMNNAVKYWQSAAAEGDPVAETELGIAYYKGEGVPRDPATAAQYFQKAADAGNAAAQANLGLMCQSGTGVPKDIQKAIRLYRQAADAGEPRGQNNLAVCYENGEGVPKDLKKALELYRKAAAQGDEHAQKSLHRLHASGAGE